MRQDNRITLFDKLVAVIVLAVAVLLAWNLFVRNADAAPLQKPVVQTICYIYRCTVDQAVCFFDHCVGWGKVQVSTFYNIPVRVAGKRLYPGKRITHEVCR